MNAPGDTLIAAHDVAAGRILRAGQLALCMQVDQVMARLAAAPFAGTGSAGDPPHAHAASALAELAGALALLGEHGLAALVERLRQRMMAAIDPDGQAGATLPELAARLRAALRPALERSFRGQAMVAGDLLPVWQALAGRDAAAEVAGAAVLVSLQADPAVDLLSPAEAEGDAALDPLPEAERALLAFLRAAGAAGRREAAGCLAALLAQVAARSDSRATQRHWLVLHAYLVELAEDHPADLAGAKNTLVHLLRALRHRADPGLPAVLAPLVRQALFELAQRPVLWTEAARQAARAYRLAEQFSASPASDAMRTDAPASPADERFVEQLGRWIAAREAGNDGPGPLEAWQSLVETAALSDRFQPVAASLRRIGARWSDLSGPCAGPWLAAVMLCLHAWATTSPQAEADGTRVASLLDSVPDEAAAAPPLLQRLASRLERQALLRSLARAFGEVLESGERLLDAATGPGDRALALRDARRLLQALAGAARLLELRSVSPLADALLAQFDALPAAGPDSAADGMTALAQTWVVLADEVAVLPWTAEWPDDPADGRLAQGEDAGHAGRASLSPVDMAGELVPVDPLVAIFLSEAACLLAQLRSALLPIDVRQPAAAPLEALHAAHTLAGCAATVGLPAMSRLAHALESLLEHAAAGSVQLADAAAPAATDEALQALDAMLAEFAESGSCRDADALVERLLACLPSTCSDSTALAADVADVLPEALVPDPDIRPIAPAADDIAATPAPEDCEEIAADAGSTPGAHAGMAVDEATPRPAATEDEELLAIFREEAADLLPRLEQALEAWRQAPDDRVAPASLLRILHTLKGSARMAGQLAWGESLHRCETDVAAMAQLAPAAIRERLDTLQALFDDWRRAWSGAGAGPPLHAATCEPTPAEAPGLPAPSTPASAGAIDPPAAMSALSRKAERGSASSLLRVRADTFATFADAVAELWMGHARLADGVQQQRRAVAELADNLARLRAQVRELEIDAESRIVSGAASTDDKGFDPLEFDRYTRLHEITRMIAESAADLGDLQRSLMRQGDGLARATDAQARELRCLQASLQSVRSQPFGTIEARLRHVLRQAARESGREVDLSVVGAAVEVDRSLLDRLAGPLEHVLRNAVAHGIELSTEREAIGKPRAGRVTLGVLLSAAELRLELADDGRGLDLDRIRDRASAIGLLAASEEPQAAALSDLIFQPGFSTASEVTALAGRGIGLDAVRAELQALGGRISVDSRAGQGCRFTLSVPLSLATLPVLLVRAGRHRIGLLAPGLQQLLQLKPGDAGYDAGSRVLRWQGEDLILHDLGQLLGEPPQPMAAGARQPVAVLRASEQLLALKLDAVDGQRELVVKPPGPQLSRVPGLAGASVLGDGGIALIVDPFRLDRRCDADVSGCTAPEAGPLILVVDDSLTVRRASQRLLERHGYDVALARDGIEALALLRERPPAAMLLDIEMPRMDGFALLAAMRDDPQLRGLPVVMITSRIADRHRQRAQQLGASAYMGKPFREEALLSLLSGLCLSTSGEPDEGRMEKQSRSHRSEAAA